jgi:hypothetical protein
MPYVDIESISYDNKKNLVTLEGTDLDSSLLMDWNKAVPDCSVTLRFDLTLAGNRIYLYKLLKSTVKGEYKTYVEALDQLVGKAINISGNFIVRDMG